MHYLPQTHSVILFGGGGPNKKRFNTVYSLDVATKTWRELIPPVDEITPWERTYHSSEMMYPYLVLFGGEGIADLDDLWVFNV